MKKIFFGGPTMDTYTVDREDLTAGRNYLKTINQVMRIKQTIDELITSALGSERTMLNHAQALILLNIGDQEMTVGDLVLHSCYVGTNVSYNLKELVARGYVSRKQSTSDKRSILIKLTNRGHSLRKRLENALEQHAATLQDHGTFDQLTTALDRFENFLQSVKQTSSYF